MERIVCALKPEAKALRKYFDDVFVCGAKVKQLPELDKNDTLINIGICAGKNVGKLYVCNKIIYDKDYYPDVKKTNIKQSAITTIDTIASPEMVEENMLYDQEAGIIYRHAKKTLGPHQMVFLKIVSDAGIKGDFNINIEKLIDDNIEDIKTFIKPAKETRNDKLSTNLKLTETLKNRLNQQYKYAQIANINIDKYLNTYTNNKFDTIKILDTIDEVLLEES